MEDKVTQFCFLDDQATIVPPKVNNQPLVDLEFDLLDAQFASL